MSRAMVNITLKWDISLPRCHSCIPRIDVSIFGAEYSYKHIYIFTYAIIVKDVFAPIILQQSLINSIKLYHQLYHHCLQSMVYHVIPS